MRWIAISPLYVVATLECSGKEQKILPLPLVHSNTKAQEHRSGYTSRIYEPSVTAMQGPALIDSSSQLSSPTNHRDFHIHMLSHSLNTSNSDPGILSGWGEAATNVMDTLPWLLSQTEHGTPIVSTSTVSCTIFQAQHDSLDGSYLALLQLL